MKAKIIFGISILAFAYLCWQYNNFENEKEFILLLLLDLTFLSFSGAAIFQGNDKSYDYKWVEQKMDMEKKEDGNFKYYLDGFYITLKKESIFIRWDDIIEIERFYVTVLADTQSGYLIKTKDNIFELNNVQLKGLTKFYSKLNENFDIIKDYTYDPSLIIPDSKGFKKKQFIKN